jgi:hypothetical protein
MPDTPAPLWNGYDDASEDDLLALLDGKAAAAGDPDDDTVDAVVSGALATAIARHEELKQSQNAGNYRPRVHARASQIAESWRP